MRSGNEPLPEHGPMGPLARAIEVACLVAAAVMILLHTFRFSAVPDLFGWRSLVAILSATLLADFASGVVHWLADTWGSQTMPVFGRRFIRPFRVHHINPDDFLIRDFIDTNGDVAMTALPLLLLAFLMPLTDELDQASAVFVVAFCATGLITNQVHQWAHMSRPPSPVYWLQRWGLLLSREAHQMHHTAPHAMNYCITTGWCNRMLTAVGFFPALESGISRLTGLRPRGEDLALNAPVEASTERGL